MQVIVTRDPGRQVGTVGHLEVSPNARNVVPGVVKHSIELRDLSPEKIARLGDEIEKRAQQIAQETKTDISMRKVEHDPPAVATPAIQSQIEAAAAGLGLKTMRLPSGAGHDAQVIATLGPMGMIFVPSVAGISRFPGMPAVTAAMVGFVLGARFCDPPIAEVKVTDDGLVVARTDREALASRVIGSYTDVVQDWLRLMAAAGLSQHEFIEAQCLFAAKVGFFGPTSA